MAAVKFSKQSVLPNPIEVDYWVDVKSDPYGSVWKYHNGIDWVDFSLNKGSGGGGMYPYDYYTKILVNQLLNNKLDINSDLYQPFLLEGENIKIDRKTNTISVVGKLSVDWDTIPNVPNNLVTSISTEDEVTNVMEIRTLVDLDTKEQFVPRTHVKAVVDDNGDSVDSILENFELDLNQHKDKINEDISNQKEELNTLSQELQTATSALDSDFNANRYGYNVTVNGLKGGIHTIETAVKDVPSKFRMLGQKITFRTENGDWATYHNESLSLDNYENVDDWVQEVGISSVQGDVNITNAPDYEDLTEAADGTLKFADKEYNAESFSGLGRVYLRKNIVNGVNVLTQDVVSKPNTIYIIQYDYDLQGVEITVPEGCILDFQGGSFSNGTIVGCNTKLFTREYIFENIKIEGTWIVDVIKTSIFKDIDKVNLLKTLLALSNPKIYNTIIIEEGDYLIDIESNKGSGLTINDNTNLIINGIIRIQPNDFTNYYIIDITNCVNVNISGKGTIIGDKYEHLGTEGEWGHGISIIDSKDITIKGLNISNCWGDCLYIIGENIVIDGLYLDNGRRQGISITNGKNIYVKNCSISNVSGTAPQCAIDIEPNAGNEVHNVVLENLNITNCVGGILIYANNTTVANTTVNNVDIIKCNIESTESPAFVVYYNVTNINIKDSNLNANIGYGVYLARQFKDIVCIENSHITSVSKNAVISGELSSAKLIIRNSKIEHNNNGAIFWAFVNTTLELYSCILNAAQIRNAEFNVSNSIFNNNIFNTSCEFGNLTNCRFYKNIFNNNLKIIDFRKGIFSENVVNELTEIYGSNYDLLNNTFKKLVLNVFGGVIIKGNRISSNDNIIFSVNKAAEENCFAIIESNIIESLHTESIEGHIAIMYISIKSTIKNNILINGKANAYAVRFVLNDNHSVSGNIIIDPDNLVTRKYWPNIKGSILDDTHDIFGSTSDLPNFPDLYEDYNSGIIGFKYFNTDLNMPLYWTGHKWVKSDGSSVFANNSGSYSEKPNSSDIKIGFAYFCIDRQTSEGNAEGIMIYHKGNDVWVDALGRVVE